MSSMGKNLKTIALTFLFVLVALVPNQSAFAQFSCVPNCDITDGRFMALAGSTFETTNNTDAFFHITSILGNPNIEIGIFDGDGLGGANGRWDLNFLDTTNVEYTLFMNPDGNGLGIGNGVV